nr:hypothetical protein [Tanacetum cinerariifolium]
MDYMIPIGQKNTFVEYMILSGADNHPPMLDKDLYDSWKSRMKLCMQNREHRRMILESVEHDPLIWPTIEENRVTKTKKYAELFATKKIQVDCDMKATNIILQCLPSNIYSLVNHHRVSRSMGKNSTTYASLPSEWSKFVTGVKLVKDLHTTNFDQLHAYLQQHELHANEVRLMREWEGHMARQCPKPKRKRDATWFREKVLLVEAQGNGKVLNEEELEFLADLGIAEGPVKQPMLYDGSVIAKETNVISIADFEETLMLEEENFGKRFVPQQELSDKQAFWLQTSHPNTDQSASSPVKVEAPRELPKAERDLFQRLTSDYPIWQVIQNRNGPISVTTDTNGIIKVLPPKTVEEVVARERERKARTALLMALPKDHLAKFHKMADAKEMWEAIKSKFGGNDESKKMQKYLLKQQFKGFFCLPQRVAMISMRIKKFHKRTGRKLQFDTKDPVGFDKTKVECFNCHKIGHFARDCRAKRNQDSRRRDAGYNENKLETMSVFMNKASDLEDTSVNDRFADGMHAVPPPTTGNYMPSGPDVEKDYSKFTYGLKQTSADESNSKPSEYASCESDSSIETSTSMHEPVENASKVVCEPKMWTDVPIIEEYESDGDNDSVSNVQEDKEKPSFAFTNFVKHVKTSRENIKEIGTTNHSLKIKKHDRNGHTRKGLGYAFTRKSCFVCGSFSHLIRDCDFHEKRMAKQAELTKSKNKVTGQRDNRPVWNNVQRVNHQTKALKDKKIIDSGCSRHMIGNKAHLADYQEFKGGSVAFGGSNGRITGKGKIKNGRLDFEDVYNVEELKHYNLFSVSQMCDKKNKKGKQHKASCKAKIVSSVNQPLQIVDIDLFRPTSDETTPILKDFIRQAKNQFNHKVKIIRSDNETEFKNKELIELCGLKRIKREYSNARTPKQNEVAKRKKKTLIEAARTMVLVTVPQNKTPYELLTGANSEEINLNEEHFVLPIWYAYSTTVKSSGDKIEKNTGCKTCEKPVSQVEQVFLEDLGKLKRQEKEANDATESLRKEAIHDIQNASTSSTNLINTASTPLSTASPSRAFNDGELSYLDPSKYALLDDPSMPHLEDIYFSPSEGIFIDSSYDDEGVVTDFNNLETTVSVSPTPTTRIHTIYPKTHILGYLKSAVQTWSKVNKNSEAHALVWILVDLPFGKKSIGTKWVYRNKKDERGVVVRNKARLVAQGHRQEERIDHDEVFALIDMIEAIRIFLAFASYPKFPNKVYNVVKALYGLHQAPRACTPIETQKPLVKDEEAVDVDVTPKTSHLHVVKIIFSKELASPKQTALDKYISNPLMAGRLPKTTLPTSHGLSKDVDPHAFTHV